MPQRTVPLARLAVAWAVLLGGLFAFWAIRPFFGTLAWTNSQPFVLFSTSKFATLVCMPPDDRRRLGWDRFVAYFLWPGMQPRHFLPERTPDDAEVKPTFFGLITNTLVAALGLWIIPALMPLDWPRDLRLLSAMIGGVFLVLFAAFDAVALAYRSLGYGVEKLWNNPLAATSLMDFWGNRWNRIFSGMLREVLFLPLARRIGAGLALFAVFLYSGLLHETFSVAAKWGYGLPTLYFLIQGIATWLENWRPLRRTLKERKWLGWLWTAVIVLGPCRLLFTESFCDEVLVPPLVGFGVPGL